jgi:uncharacterized protein (TIGR00369 family)
MSGADLSTGRSKTVTWEDPSVSAAAMASMSGLELLQGIIEGRIPPPPIAELFGARLVSIGDGSARFTCLPDESTYNPIGLVHGGMLCTLLDSAAGCAVHTMLPAGVGYSTVEIKVSFLAAVRADTGTIEAEGRVLRLGRQIAFAEAHARTADGKLVGHATTSLAVMRPG